MQHVVKHNLDNATAKLAAQKAYESYSERFAKYKPTAEWTSDTHCDVTFTVKGITVEGSIDMRPGHIDMDLDVPFLFRPFKTLALDYTEKEIRTWIERAERGEFAAKEE